MNAQAEKYTQTLQELGPVAWCEGPHGWTGEDGKPITLAPWQRAALSAWWENRQDVSTFAISNVKKTGKTFCDAVLLCWRWLALPGLHFAAANDLDQAQARQFSEISDMVRRSPFLSENVKAGKSELVFTLTGSRLVALALDAPGASGANHLTASHTEAWAVIYESGVRMWEELTPPPGKTSGLPCLRIADSYAGFENESKTWHELIDRGVNGEQVSKTWPIYQAGGLLLFHATGEEARERCYRGSKEEAEAYYKDQAASLRPNTFIRMHGNERTTGESAFVTPEAWQACYSPEVKPITQADRVKLFLGADASTSRDFTSLVGVDDRDVRLVRVWKPQRGLFRKNKPTIDIDETVGQAVLDLHKRGQIAVVTADPFQLHTCILKWEKAGIKVIEMAQTGARVEADQGLYDAINSRSLRHYNDPALNEAIQNAVAIETPRGFRLAKEKTRLKIDAAVALSMALSAATDPKYQPSVWAAQPDPWEASLEDMRLYALFNSPDTYTQKHPEGITWRNCRKQAKGCAACVAELTKEGYYKNQELEARLMDHPDPDIARQQDRLRNEIMNQGEYHDTKSLFEDAVRRKLAGHD
jgi:phage terminase large subunit-like protein